MLFVPVICPRWVARHAHLGRSGYKWMLGWAKEGVMGNSKNASFQIYFNSLGGCAIIELKVRAKEMWKELSRGFSSCGRFDPNVDIPIGLKNFK